MNLADRIESFTWEIPKGYTVTRDGDVFDPQGNPVRKIRHFGYYRITIKRKHYFVHRLVALAYIPNPERKPYIDHIDGRRDNNHVENLRWVTPQENASTPLARKHISEAQKTRNYPKETLERVKKMVSAANSKPILCIDRETGEERIFPSEKATAEFMGCRQSYVSRYALGMCKHKKYICKFLKKK